MTPLMSTARRHRTAFTLIELMVVITIIIVLMSLLMAGVQRALDAGKRTDNIDRMAQVGSAVGLAKQKLNMPYVWSGPFKLRSIYQQGDPELDILLQMFPNMNWGGSADNGYTGADVILDANQALVLLLTGGAPTGMTGFSTDPRKPFSAAGASRKGPMLEANPKWFDASSGHPRLIDPFNNPYIVFAATKGKNGNYAKDNYGNPQTITVGSVTVSPYLSGTGFVNAAGFQIISAGKDKMFGVGGATLPGVGSPGGEDDQANFSRATLGSGIQ
jgi:hypothetical protein